MLQLTKVWISFVQLMFAGAYVMVPSQKFWIIFVAPHSLVVLGATLTLGRQLASSLSSQRSGKEAGTGAGKIGKGKGRARIGFRAKQGERGARQGPGQGQGRDREGEQGQGHVEKKLNLATAGGGPQGRGI